MGDRRARPAARAHRCRRLVRQEPGAGLPRHEPERPGADAGRRGRFSAVGIESIVRYLAAKHKSTTFEPSDLRTRANASKWMDWQLAVAGPAIFECFWGLIRTPPEKRDHAAIEDSKKKTTAAMAMIDEQLGNDRLSRRRRVLLWRYSGRHHGLSLSPAGARAAAAAAISSAGMRRSPSARRSRTRSRRAAVVVSFRGARSASPESITTIAQEQARTVLLVQ